MYGCGKYCLIRIHLGGHRSAVSLSALNVSPLTQTIALMWGSDPGFSSPPVEGRSSPTNTPVFLPSSLVLPSFAWFYIFFNTGQVLLSALSWCSACTFVSEGVLHIHLLLCHLVLPLSAFNSTFAIQRDYVSMPISFSWSKQLFISFYPQNMIY